MDNYHEKERNNILINFDNENYEVDHDYSKPFNRIKISTERNSFSKDDNVLTESFKSKKTNKNMDDSDHLNALKKDFKDINDEFFSLKNDFNENIKGREFIKMNQFLKFFSFVEKQNILIKVILKAIWFSFMSDLNLN